MDGEGTILSVHSYPRYVDEEAFLDVAEELSEEFPIYGVKSSGSSSELVGDFYEDSFEDINNGRNGYISPKHLESLESPFYVVGGLVSECIPGAAESVLRSGEDAYIVEEGAFEKVGDGFFTYEDMSSSDQDFSDIFRNLNELGVPSVNSYDFFRN